MYCQVYTYIPFIYMHFTMHKNGDIAHNIKKYTNIKRSDKKEKERKNIVTETM